MGAARPVAQVAAQVQAQLGVLGNQLAGEGRLPALLEDGLRDPLHAAVARGRFTWPRSSWWWREPAGRTEPWQARPAKSRQGSSPGPAGQDLPPQPTVANEGALAARWIAKVVVHRRHRTTGQIVGTPRASERPPPIDSGAHLTNPDLPSSAFSSSTIRTRGAQRSGGGPSSSLSPSASFVESAPSTASGVQRPWPAATAAAHPSTPSIPAGRAGGRAGDQHLRRLQPAAPH